MNPSDFFTQLDEIALAIENHPSLEILEYSRNDGASEDEIAQTEAALDTTLAPEIKAFYKTVDGFTFQWEIKSGLDEDTINALLDKSEDYGLEPPFDDEELENPNAKIQFLPLEKSLISINWAEELAYDTGSDEEVIVAGKNMTEGGVYRALKPFDMFSEYSCAALLVEEGQTTDKVLWLTNECLSWHCSRVTDFQSYLQLVVATFGLTEAREKYLEEYKGAEKPSIHWGDSFPTVEKPLLFT